MTAAQRYTDDTTRISYGEYWRWKPGLTFLVVAARKLLGLPMRTGNLFLEPDRVMRYGWEDVPEALRDAMVATLGQFGSEGFGELFLYRLPVESPNPSAAMALLARDRRSLGLIAIAESPTGRHRQISYGCISRTTDGDFVATGNGRGLIKPPPHFRSLSMRGGTVADVVRAHSVRLAGETSTFVAIDEGRAEAVILESARQAFEYNVSRGVYVPVTEGRPAS